MAQYTTGELAKLAGVTVRTVQYYDEKGLLKPSDLTEGGRRLYTEADLTTLRAIMLLKDLNFSLKDIAAILSEDDPMRILGLLMDEQESELESRIAEDRARIERIRELRGQLKHMNSVDTESLGAIATIMGNRKKLHRMYIMMVPVGLLMDVLWIGTLIYGIVSGIWWPFASGLAVTVLLGIWMSVYYYHHVAYVCPEDHTIFRPPFMKMLFANHTPSTRVLVCPTCKNKERCLEIYVPDSQPERVGTYLIWSEGADR